MNTFGRRLHRASESVCINSRRSKCPFLHSSKGLANQPKRMHRNRHNAVALGLISTHQYQVENSLSSLSLGIEYDDELAPDEKAENDDDSARTKNILWVLPIVCP